MSEEKINKMKDKMNAILNLRRAPSQSMIFYHLLETGRTISVKEMASELTLTAKAAERAVAKLIEKGLIQRASFRQSAYTCDSKQLLLGLLLLVTEHQDRLKKLES
jgi:predicted transcriptional regulator